MEERTAGHCDIIISHVMLPQDANPAGNVHGGVIMKHIDNAAAVVAVRHARCNVVTASIDRLNFYHPCFIGNLLTLKASLNHVGKTSMEIGVRVETEDLITGDIRHAASAYLTFVALDEEGTPQKLPPFVPKTADECRRNREAEVRRKARLAERRRVDKGRSAPCKC
jgi:acyl-CoA hydrolase